MTPYDTFKNKVSCCKLLFLLLYDTYDTYDAIYI